MLHVRVRARTGVGIWRPPIPLSKIFLPVLAAYRVKGRTEPTAGLTVFAHVIRSLLAATPRGAVAFAGALPEQSPAASDATASQTAGSPLLGHVRVAAGPWSTRRDDLPSRDVQDQPVVRGRPCPRPDAMAVTRDPPRVHLSSKCAVAEDHGHGRPGWLKDQTWRK